MAETNSKKNAFFTGVKKEWAHIEWKDKETVLKEFGLIAGMTAVISLLSISVDSLALGILNLFH